MRLPHHGAISLDHCVEAKACYTFPFHHDNGGEMSPLLRKMRVVTLTVIAWHVFIALSLEIYSRFAFEGNSYGVHQLGEIVYER